MEYANKLDSILEEAKVFFLNFSPNKVIESEEDIIYQAKKFEQGLSVMESTYNQLDSLQPELNSLQKHLIIKKSFGNVVSILKEINKLLDLDPKNLGSAEVKNLIDQIKF